MDPRTAAKITSDDLNKSFLSGLAEGRPGAEVVPTELVAGSVIYRVLFFGAELKREKDFPAADMDRMLVVVLAFLRDGGRSVNIRRLDSPDG
jgi:hypothetical protein